MCSRSVTASQSMSTFWSNSAGNDHENSWLLLFYNGGAMTKLIGKWMRSDIIVSNEILIFYNEISKPSYTKV